MRWTVMTLGISIASLALGCTGSDAEPTGGGNGNPATAVPRFVSPVVTGPALTAKPGVGAWFYQKAGEATSVLSIKNVSAAGQTVTVPFRNTNGALLASPARALATGETWRLDTSALPQLEGLSGSFEVSAAGGPDTVVVEAHANALLPSGAVAYAAPITVRPSAGEPGHGAYFHQDAGVTTTVEVHNISSASQNATVTFYDDQGVELANQTAPIAANALWRLDASTIPALAGQRGSFRVQSAGGPETILAQAEVVTAQPAPAVAYVVPVPVSQPAAGLQPGLGAYFRHQAGAAVTILTLRNVGDTLETMTVHFYGAAGAMVGSVSRAVAPGTQWRFDTSAVAGMGTAEGAFRIERANNVAAIFQAEVAVLRPAGGIAYVVPVTVIQPVIDLAGDQAGAYFHEQPEVATTALSIANHGPSGQNVTVVFSSPDGAQLHAASATVGAGGSWQLRTGDVAGLAGRSGTFRVQVPAMGSDEVVVQAAVLCTAGACQPPGAAGGGGVVDAGGGDVDAGGSGDADSAGGDTASSDTAVADTGADSNVADTNVADTIVGDTNVADTNVADTNTADTNAADANAADTGTSDTANPDVCTTPAPWGATAAIGPAGGTLQWGEVKVTVGAGALASETELTLAPVADVAAIGVRTLTSALRLSGPGGQPLTAQVKVGFAPAPGLADPAQVALFAGTSGLTAQAVATTVAEGGKAVEATIDGKDVFFAARNVPAPPATAQTCAAKGATVELYENFTGGSWYQALHPFVSAGALRVTAAAQVDGLWGARVYKLAASGAEEKPPIDLTPKNYSTVMGAHVVPEAAGTWLYGYDSNKVGGSEAWIGRANADGTLAGAPVNASKDDVYSERPRVAPLADGGALIVWTAIKFSPPPRKLRAAWFDSALQAKGSMDLTTAENYAAPSGIALAAANGKVTVLWAYASTTFHGIKARTFGSTPCAVTPDQVLAEGHKEAPVLAVAQDGAQAAVAYAVSMEALRVRLFDAETGSPGKVRNYGAIVSHPGIARAPGGWVVAGVYSNSPQSEIKVMLVSDDLDPLSPLTTVGKANAYSEPCHMAFAPDAGVGVVTWTSTVTNKVKGLAQVFGCQ